MRLVLPKAERKAGRDKRVPPDVAYDEDVSYREALHEIRELEAAGYYKGKAGRREMQAVTRECRERQAIGKVLRKLARSY